MDGDEAIIADILLEWDEQWQQGRDIPAADLCIHHPRLADELARRIKALKAMAWLDHELSHAKDPKISIGNNVLNSRVLGGRYRLDVLFGEGGFACVWKAFDLELQRIVAVKFPKLGRMNSAESFMAEARRVARLKHPGIVPVHDVGREDGACYIVSEFMEGGSLSDRIPPAPSAGSPRWPRRWTMPTKQESFTATSSPKTSSSTVSIGRS